MEDTPSSTSSSEARPGRGLVLALALLGLWAALAPAGGRPSLPGDDAPLTPYLGDLSDVAGAVPPEVLVVGDSRVYQVLFPPFSRGMASGPLPSGRVWGEGGGTLPDMLGFLAERNIRPGVLVLGVDPSSVCVEHFLRSFRSGRDGEERPLLRLKQQVRRAFLRPLAFLPNRRCSELLAGWAFPRITRAFPTLERVETRWQATAPPNIVGFQALYTVEAVPSERALGLAIKAVREAQAHGTRVVLARLPVSPGMRALEDGWGGGQAIARLAEETGCPLVDFQKLAVYPLLQASITDGSHVMGEEPIRLMSEELGRQVRAALGGDGPAPRRSPSPP